ncbi:MAG: hypothetical protein H6684_09255 [Deltaproteobacteria bacterium]|nr:hypothetical protein [Deltaproteobacteria bacterium]
MDEIHGLRDSTNADLVALIVGESDEVCGCAYIPTDLEQDNEDLGFSATALNCAVANHSFVHEIGHNFGARHDHYVDPVQNQPFADNHGHIIDITDDPIAGQAGFRTIMAYNSECDDYTFGPVYCERLPLFSSPEILYVTHGLIQSICDNGSCAIFGQR